MIKRLAKIFIIYLLSCISISFVCAVIYKLMGLQQTYTQIFIYAFVQILNCNVGNHFFSNPNIVTIFNQFMGQILFVIMTGYTVSAIYSSNKKDIVLADKMIIRKRTSPGVENDITISVMVENKNKHNFYNVRCEMTCLYYKSENANETNRDTYCFKPLIEIVNYNRFSFALEELPIKFWETLINKDGINFNELAIQIRLTGKFDTHDNEISVRKTYKMSDIVIAKGSEEIIYKITENGNTVKKSRPKWNNINKIIEYNEIERQEIVLEIINHINKVNEYGVNTK